MSTVDPSLPSGGAAAFRVKMPYLLNDPMPKATPAERDALLQSADTLLQMGRTADAITLLEQVTRRDPGHAPTWTRLGGLYHAAGRFERCLAAADHVVALLPGSAVAWNNRGMALDALRRPQPAVESFDRALAIDPDNPGTLCNRARVLNHLGRFDESLASLDRALVLAPQLALALLGRSVPLRGLGRLAEALASAERALEIEPANAAAWGQKGWVLLEMCRYAEAESSLRNALILGPGDPQARYNLALVDLTLGRLPRGFAGYEARTVVLDLPEFSLPGVPVWQPGMDVAGKTIALKSEQGYGDTLQFCRFARVLAERGAQVVLLVPPPLQRLLGSLGEGVRALSAGDPLPPIDLQCWLLGVMHRLGVDHDSIPAATPYLKAPASLQRYWQQKFEVLHAGATPRRRMGLAFSGSPTHANDARRSIALERLAPVLQRAAAAGVEWHLVQADVRPADEPWLERLGIVDHRSELQDFSETGALVACMDGVVSVDTAVAHLAGAFGVPLYLLLPANPDWRWMLERTDSPWYPGARLFRQDAPGNWDAALERLAEVLEAEARA